MTDKNVEQIFENYVNLLKSLAALPGLDLSNERKLQLYALYKQSTDGQCLAPAPSFFDIKGRHKHSAWSNLGNMSKFDAMTNYVEAVHDIFNDESIYPDDGSYDDIFHNALNEINSLYDLYSRNFRQIELSSEGLYEKEEESLFQPGSEVFFDNNEHSSIIDTVQEFVKQDISELTQDQKSFEPKIEDPLNVMEPRPSKNLSEESLLIVAKPFNELMEMILETNKRVDLIEAKLEHIFKLFSIGNWSNLVLKSKIVRNCLKVALASIPLWIILRVMLKRIK